MDSPQKNPVPNTPALAIAALENDLPKVLGGQSLEEAGWRKPDSLTLLIPLVGRTEDERHDYLLKLHFGYYPEWPPSAQFLNPQTMNFAGAPDQCWLPKIEGSNEIGFHVDYEKKGQLICCSTTLEFYLYGHSLNEEHRWDYKRMNFAATLTSIRRVLQPPYYLGRQ